MFPGESAEYRAARDRLLEQEIELRRFMERVAVARRELPPGGVLPEDYVFQGEGSGGLPTDVRLSELFAPGKDSLVIYSMMFPRDPGDDRPGPREGQTALLPLLESPCPSCTALLDQLDGAAEHVCDRVNLVVVAKSPLARILAFADERGWRRLRFLSSLGNTYNRDYLAETTAGHQRPMLATDAPRTGTSSFTTDDSRHGSSAVRCVRHSEARNRGGTRKPTRRARGEPQVRRRGCRRACSWTW
jgi:predicted dithiol-disulfide oxidoreductase (DUF899 family)